MITELLLSTVAALTMTGTDDICTISGNITGMTEDSEAYVLSILGGTKRDTIQRAEIKDGRFSMVIDSKYLGNAYEMAIGKHPAHFVVFTENGTVTVKGDYGQLFFTEATGTRANDEYCRYRKQMAKSSQERDVEMVALDKETLDTSLKKAHRDELIKKYNAIMDKHVENLIGDGTSLAALFIFWQKQMMYTADEIDATLAKFSPSMASSPYYKGLEDRSQTLRSTSPGAMAPVFTAVTPDGKTISNADLKGKYYILDFWASWCHPCRKEGENIKVIYEMLKDKNFDVLSVSSDKNEAAWRKAMTEDAMTWKQGLLVGDNLKAVHRQYGIVGIPAIWVVDSEGKIIAKQLRGDNLKQFCLNLFK